MQINITFKGIEPSRLLKLHVQKNLDKFDKMLDGPAEARVVLSVEKIRHIAEVSVTCGQLNINAKERSEEMYSSIDTLMDKVRAQITKNKGKLRGHMSGDKQSIKDGVLDGLPETI